MPPSAKRSRSSPSFIFDADESSQERSYSPILSGPKRNKLKLNQLPISSFTTPLADAKLLGIKKLGQPQAQPPVASANPVLKLFVRIQEKVLLIPVDQSRTLQWLAEEAARRYYNMTGLNPVLSLHTEDGAVLNGDDVVSVILRDGEKIVGQIDKWDLQPLPERYSSACRQMETGASLTEMKSLRIRLQSLVFDVYSADRTGGDGVNWRPYERRAIVDTGPGNCTSVACSQSDTLPAKSVGTESSVH